MLRKDLQELWNGLAPSQKIRFVLFHAVEVSDTPVQLEIQ